MALFNVNNDNDKLLATTNNAVATSEIITQDVEDTDFESIRETRVIWNLANISDVLSSSDNLVSNTPINDGDRLILVKNDNSIVDFIATGVQKNTAGVAPQMTSNVLPAGVATSSYDNSLNAYKAFNNNTGDGAYSTYNKPYWIAYNFENNERKLIKNVYCKALSGSGSSVMTEIHVQGSMDGIIWQTLSIHKNLNSTETIKGRILTIQSPSEYSHYRLYTPNCRYGYFSEISFLNDEGDVLDTSIITAGETPNKVFKFTDVLKFNGSQAIEKDIYLEYGISGTKLLAFPIYHDVILTGRTLTTTVEFSAAGNEVSEISGQIYKAL